MEHYGIIEVWYNYENLRFVEGPSPMNPTTTALFDNPKKGFSDFTLKDYELEVAYLSNHFQRMWTRFKTGS